jgi:hypothetical protein
LTVTIALGNFNWDISLMNLSETVAEPRVGACYFEEVFQPRLAAMRLEWPDPFVAQEQQSWKLPDGVTLGGPAPAGFGIHLLRFGPDCYALHLVWNQLHLAWKALTRDQLLQSCLGALLASLGTDLQYLLDQPVVPQAVVA